MSKKEIEWLSLNVFAPDGQKLVIYPSENKRKSGLDWGEVKRLKEDFKKNGREIFEYEEAELYRDSERVYDMCAKSEFMDPNTASDHDDMYFKIMGRLLSSAGFIEDADEWTDAYKGKSKDELEKEFKARSYDFFRIYEMGKHNKGSGECHDLFSKISLRVLDDKKMDADLRFIQMKKAMIRSSKKITTMPDADEVERHCVPSIRFQELADEKETYCIVKKYSYCRGYDGDLYMRRCIGCGCSFSTLLFPGERCPECGNFSVVSSVMNGQYADIPADYIQKLADWAEKAMSDPPDDIDGSLKASKLSPNKHQAEFFDEFYRAQIEGKL